ncbi:hypothetical protein [Halotia branconii]|uniref:Uncharacterized protein n=1 Tax=Halotia branconii CENA392 TaxID=1539056 RepID=A0AAJ6NSQ0_9CYAN|nr:hypothetical protein [Halotia branconii]WGV26005.1 hypothetical protein QI031_00320 [Halotia branconii CENA392]
MKSHLIIADLSYIQHITESNDVIGGNAVAATITEVGSGYALALALADAKGLETKTDARTLARVKYYENFTVSLADARATAFARTRNKTSRASSLSTSTSLDFTSFSSFTTSL